MSGRDGIAFLEFNATNESGSAGDAGELGKNVSGKVSPLARHAFRRIPRVFDRREGRGILREEVHGLSAQHDFFDDPFLLAPLP